MTIQEKLQGALNGALAEAFKDGLTLAEVVGALELNKLAVADEVSKALSDQAKAVKLSEGVV